MKKKKLLDSDVTEVEGEEYGKLEGEEMNLMPGGETSQTPKKANKTPSFN